jgi:CelD/BcsL family acetyltransferase involved in cellulose biosynthesis
VKACVRDSGESVLDTELIVDPAKLRELTPEWEELVEVGGPPMAHPAWMLGWLEHLTAPGAAARVVAIREHGQLVGLAPFFVDLDLGGRVDYRLFGSSTRVSPLSRPGREWDAARGVMEVLAQASPRPDTLVLESAPLASHWPMALREGWLGRTRPIMRQYFVQSSPTISLEDDSFETWLAGKSSKFRQEMRLHRRQLDAAGGSWRMCTQQTLREDIATFMRLHTMRWEGRGQSSIVTYGERMTAMLEAVGRASGASDPLRIWIVEIDGEAIAAQLCAAAGGEVLFINGGWDERFAKLSPAMLAKLAALEDSFARGERRVDLGPGEQPAKRRMADGNDPVAWTILMLPSHRLPITYVRSAPMLAGRRVREAAKRTLDDRQTNRLRRLRRGLPWA